MIGICGVQGNSSSTIHRSGSRRADRGVAQRPASGPEETGGAGARVYTPLDPELLNSLAGAAAPNVPLKPVSRSGGGSTTEASRGSTANIGGASTASVSKSTPLNLSKHRRRDGDTSALSREDIAEVATTIDELGTPSVPSQQQQQRRRRRRRRKKRSDESTASPEVWRALNEVRSGISIVTDASL